MVNEFRTNLCKVCESHSCISTHLLFSLIDIGRYLFLDIERYARNVGFCYLFLLGFYCVKILCVILF